MENLLAEIDSLQSDLNYKKKQLEEIVDRVKEENGDRYGELADKDYFRHALSITLGGFLRWVTLHPTIKLEQAQTWKSNEYLNYYKLFKRVQDYDTCSNYPQYKYVSVGFVCYKEHLHNAVDIKPLWIDFVKNERFEGSLQEFTELYKDVDKLLGLCKEKSKHSFICVDYPELALNNIIICMYNK